MVKQAIKKGAGIQRFSVKDLKVSMMGSEEKAKTADKPLEWIIMPDAFQKALNLPGIACGRLNVARGWSDTGKSTLKNCIIAASMKQGMLPIIFETEGNFDFQYAKDCGMAIEPVYGEIETEIVNEETGEITVETKEEIVDWEGDYFLFTNKKICEFCGNMDYSTGTQKKTYRTIPVIEDIAYIINTFLDKQDNGEIPMPLVFIWDSCGSVSSYKSVTFKVGNNQFDAGAISQSFKSIFSRISASKEIGAPYTNTMFIVNKIWQDAMNSVGGAVAIENSGGKTIQFNMRLGIHVGGVAKAGTKKLKCTYKGEEYQYGTLTKVSIFKNHLPSPFNVTYAGTMCCVHNGIISEDELPEYKKKYIPILIEKMKQTLGEEKTKGINAEDIQFTEEGELE